MTTSTRLQTFVIPSEVNHLDPDVPLHSVDVWPLQEGVWCVEYRYDFEIFYQTTAPDRATAMDYARSILLKAVTNKQPICPDTLRGDLVDILGQPKG